MYNENRHLTKTLTSNERTNFKIVTNCVENCQLSCRYVLEGSGEDERCLFFCYFLSIKKRYFKLLRNLTIIITLYKQ